MSKKTIRVNDIIFDKIKFRYHFMTSQRIFDRKRQNKILLDTFYPYEVANAVIRKTSINRNIHNAKGYCISERVAADLGVKKLHISELTSMLGHTKTDIGKILQSVKNRQLNIALVGLGGTGSNFIHWLYEMCEWTGKTEVFRSLIGYDDDDFDVPNLLRIPFVPENRATVSSKKVHCIPDRYKAVAQTITFIERRMVSDDISVNGFKKTNSFVYGAPDIETRQMLSDHDRMFFAATHRDNEYSVVANPDVDNDLMMETYGKINLSLFFLNHLSMTIDFLDYLKDATIEMGSQENNYTIVRSDFGERYSEKITAGFKAGSKKLYPIMATPQNNVELNLPEER